MPERRSPLADLAREPRADGSAAVRFSEIRHVGKLNLRGDADDRAFLAAVGKALDLLLPTEVGRTAVRGEATALTLGPDEWLLVTPTGAETRVAAALREALTGLEATLTDVTDGRTVIRVAGPRARDVLAKGCPLDLDARAFQPERVAQSLVAEAEIIVHRITPDDAAGSPVFDLYVARSFAEYLWQWLEDAAAEFGVTGPAPV